MFLFHHHIMTVITRKVTVFWQLITKQSHTNTGPKCTILSNEILFHEHDKTMLALTHCGIGASYGVVHQGQHLISSWVINTSHRLMWIKLFVHTLNSLLVLQIFALSTLIIKSTKYYLRHVMNKHKCWVYHIISSAHSCLSQIHLLHLLIPSKGVIKILSRCSQFKTCCMFHQWRWWCTAQSA